MGVMGPLLLGFQDPKPIIIVLQPQPAHTTNIGDVIVGALGIAGAITLAATTMPSPCRTPPDALIFLSEFEASTSATMANTTGQTTNEPIALTSAQIAPCSVCGGPYPGG